MTNVLDLPVAVYSPLHRRAWRMTLRDYRLLASASVFNGSPSSQRKLAADSGFSLGGVNAALEGFVTGGLVTKHATRGRLGRTVVRIRAGVHVIGSVLGNVQSSVTTFFEEVRNHGVNISTDEHKPAIPIAVNEDGTFRYVTPEERALASLHERKLEAIADRDPEPLPDLLVVRDD